MTAEKDDEKNRLTRRTLLLSAASAAALSQLGCGFNRPVSRIPPSAWLAYEVSFDGDFAEKDRNGRGWLRCISPVIFGYDAGRRILGIERYDGNAPGSRGVVNVWLEKVTRMRLSADNGPINYACSIGNVGTDQFLTDVLAAFSRIGFLDRPGYTPVPSETFLPVESRELTIDTILAYTAKGPNERSIEIDDARLDLDLARREVGITCPTSAADRCSLDDVRMLSIEASLARNPRRLSLDVEVYGRAGEIGDASLDVLRLLADARPSDRLLSNRAFIRP